MTEKNELCYDFENQDCRCEVCVVFADSSAEEVELIAGYMREKEEDIFYQLNEI